MEFQSVVCEIHLINNILDTVECKVQQSSIVILALIPDAVWRCLHIQYPHALERSILSK